MTSRKLFCGILILGASVEAGVRAQAQMQASGSVESQTSAILPVATETRRQVEGFERSLRGAIDAAAAQLNKRLEEALPNLQFQLQFQTQPLVTGVVMPDDNAIFHVLIPMIEQTGVRIIELYNATRATSPGTRVSATTGALVVDPDPVGTPAPRAPFNPDSEYTKFARQALIDALLDNGMSLPLPAEKTLTVIAGELLPQNSPFVSRSRSLILQIKSEDLLALRERRISRDDAKARIREFRY